MSRINKAHRTQATFAAAASATVALVAACGGSSADEIDERYGVANQLAGVTYGQGGAGGAPTGQAGTSAVGGTSAVAGTGGTGAMTPPAMPAAPAAPDAASGPAQECNGPDVANGVFGTPAPSDGTLVDFGTYTPRTAAGGGAWGDMGLNQITGGTSVYSGDAASALAITVESGELHLVASMDAMGDYTGIVLWFAPCVNASAFGGLSFPLSGALGGARLLVKAQTSPNYPVDVTNTKGKCEYPREDMKFTTCQQPTVTLTELTENPLTLSWDEFVAGQPLVTPDPAQLLGFELQFQCQAASGGCALDVSVGDVHFIPPP